MDKYEQLRAAIGEENAEKLMMMTACHDEYTLKFKKAMNDILNQYGYEVLLGISFREINPERTRRTKWLRLQNYWRSFLAYLKKAI